MSPAPTIIITADDFGMARSVNEGTIRALEKGHVNSTSLLTNGPAFDDAVRRAKEGAWPVGIHLALVQEPPVAPPESVDSLLDEEGRLPGGYRDFLGRYWFGGMDRDQLRREIRAQVEKVVDTGLSVTHIDSHQHLHMLPGILNIVMDVAEEFMVPAIRVADEQLLRWRSISIPLAGLKLLAKWAKRRLDRRGFCYNDRFRGVLQQKAPVRSDMELFLGQLKSGVTEFGCHLAVEEIEDAHRIRKDRDFPGTFEWMMSDEFDRLLKDSAVRTTSWKELVEES